jgi:NADH-quinone oxidoreductase subunit E
MNGAENVLAHVERKLGIKPGQTTPDGRYTLSVVECLGSCGTAPMMMVNDGYHENLTFTKLDALLEGLK